MEPCDVMFRKYFVPIIYKCKEVFIGDDDLSRNISTSPIRHIINILKEYPNQISHFSINHIYDEEKAFAPNQAFATIEIGSGNNIYREHISLPQLKPLVKALVYNECIRDKSSQHQSPLYSFREFFWRTVIEEVPHPIAYINSNYLGKSFEIVFTIIKESLMYSPEHIALLRKIAREVFGKYWSDDDCLHEPKHKPLLFKSSYDSLIIWKVVLWFTLEFC